MFESGKSESYGAGKLDIFGFGVRENFSRTERVYNLVQKDFCVREKFSRIN